jgi:hypothetical protein
MQRFAGPLIVVIVLAGAVLLALRAGLPPSVAEGDQLPQAAEDIFNPRTDPVELPDGYRPVVGRDVIRPIYDPRFVPADQAAWPGDTLVLGVAFDGEAKAYPVNVLNSREMVIDRLRGIPLLVTW